MENPNEAVVWQHLKQGDKRALDYFYDTYVQSLYNYGRKITNHEALVKDCIQELFIDIWRNKNILSYPRSLKFYLLKSLRYKIIHQLKKEKRKLQIEHLSLDMTGDHEPSYEFDLIASQCILEKQQQLRKGLKKLSNRQREAVVLKFYEELSYEEIASVMSVHPQSVYNLIHQSIEILKKSLVIEITLFALLQSMLLFF